MTDGSDAGSSRERELKLGVPDEAAFRALLDAAGGRRDGPVLQVNHFFDTADQTLRARRIGLRIRREGGRFTLTVKGPTGLAPASALKDRVELERSLAPERARAALEGALPALSLLEGLDVGEGEGALLVGAAREACADAPLGEIGAFSNARTFVHTELDGLPVVLEFDRTEFSEGEVRFEIELELAPGDPTGRLTAALESLFESVGIAPAPTTSKLTRFLEVLDRR
ncbi:CYTH domain-containing protein [bacterium]|nr:CYTH domain-containing protein [bacterium]